MGEPRVRAVVPESAERGRIKQGPMATPSSFGMAGMFIIPGPCGVDLRAMVSDGADWIFEGPAWEHVSVSTAHRTPNWKEMEFIRDLFWREDELVLQFSVPRNQHINVHPNCLHLWKPVGVEIPMPPSQTVA